MAKAHAPMVGDCFKAACPAREIVTHVSSRWGGLILAALLERDLRYSEIRARIDGISEKMLAQMLDVLERDGLISRTSRPVVPPHVEYALTASGRDLAQRFMDLFRWIGANVDTFVTAQKAFDARGKAQP
ncbi:MAG: helix-turn-helix domain-containing protein [Vulcanimicrobiaceae bacterium]|jgi:DNA-binding HxlR family transcriptional regulator